MTTPLSPIVLYGLTFFSALVLSLLFTPAAREAAVYLDIIDHPSSSVKTHKEPVPYLGGIAIYLAFSLSLLWVRVLTSFPTGTLRSLRGILIGGFFIFILGLVDDVKPKGLHYSTKFLFQISAAVLLILFGINIKFIQPTWMGIAITIIWIVGLTNAFNLIDIMDGLASGIAALAALAFLFISLPTEEIYVNFAAAALAGAALGFFPYNVSKGWRIFMGDCGSLFLGFVASALAMGTSYGETTQISVFAPLMILAIPLFDTLLVFYLRLRRGQSPFVGSKDHFPLRLELLGWPRKKILLFCLLLTALLSVAAFAVTRLAVAGAIGVFAGVILMLAGITVYVLRAKLS